MGDTFQLPTNWLEICRPVTAASATISAKTKNNNQLPKDWLKLARLLLAQQEIARLKRENAALAELSTTDALTGVPNRRGMGEKIRKTVAALVRHNTAFPHEQKCMAIAIADIDHFKKVNDKHGHQAGDEVLKQVGSTLQDQVRANEIVGRYGGEEFIIFLEVPLQDADWRCLKATDRLREAVLNNALIINQDQLIPAIHLSVGSTLLTPSKILALHYAILDLRNDVEKINNLLQIDRKDTASKTNSVAAQMLAETIQKADEALYGAKESGRGMSVLTTGDNHYFCEIDRQGPPGAILLFGPLEHFPTASRTPPTRGTPALPPAPPAPGG